jgi:hypothetical protein
VTLRLPKDARRVAGAKPWDELHKHVNELYWGDRERSGPPAAGVTPFRGVVVIGCVLAQRTDLAGELVLRTGGVFTFDDQQPEVARALAAQLREAADALEREAGS